MSSSSTDLTQLLIAKYGLTSIITNGTAGGNNGAFRTVGNQTFLDLPNGTTVDITGYFNGTADEPVPVQAATTGAGITPTASFTVQPVSSPPPIGIQADYDAYWATSKVGSYLDFAGGVLYRYSDNEAVFIVKDRNKEYTIAKNSNLDDIASIIPEVREVWRQEYGFEPTRPELATATVNADNWNPIYKVYADANRDPFATNRGVVFDAEIRAVDLSNIKNPNLAWEKLAIELYGGKNMTIQDIARLESAVYAVGRYTQNANGTYDLPPQAFAEVAAVSSATAGPGTVNASSSNLFSTGPSSSTAIAATAAALAAAQSNGVNFSFGPGSVDTLVNNATGAVTGIVNTATGAVDGLVKTAVAVPAAAIAGFQSAAQALSSAQNLISGAIKSPAALPTSLSPFVQALSQAGNTISGGLTQIENLFSGQASTLLKAKNQATLQSRYNQAASPDWRVRLQLAPGADYLYKEPGGILDPLFQTNGVLFPYMPSIETSYSANYDKFDLTHSNYRGYFYKGSAVNDINIRATFTAQDTQEANYVLAVIHFFRSVTKMFYGQDPQRGAPPPLVFLSGLGNFQFNQHPCLVANFSYSLPNEVDYIRAQAPNNYGNLFTQRAKTGAISNIGLGTVATRLLNNALTAGAVPTTPNNGYINNNVNNLNNATYVPTKMEINITLLPTNTRAQVSQQFSVKDFANGKLIKGGFW